MTSNEDSPGDRRTSPAGLRRSFVTDRAEIDAELKGVTDRILTMIGGL
jgi:hypothetical protein